MLDSYGYKGVETLDHRPSTISSPVTYNDDVALKLGTGGTASVLWETADANAHALVVGLPNGGAVDVPVIAIGDQSIINKDLATWSGITVPTVVIYNADETAYLALDGTPSIKSGAAINLMPSGDTDDYLTFSTASNIPTITATGAVQLNICCDTIRLLNTAGTGNPYLNLGDGRLETVGQITMYPNGAITTLDGDGYEFSAYVRDSGVGSVKIMSWIGAADPFVQIGRDDTGVATNAVTDGLVFQMGAGTNNEAAGQGFGLSIKLGNAASEVEERASIDTVLQTATNGSEDASIIFNAMVAGAAPSTILAMGGYAGVQKVGFFGSAPVAKAAHIANSAGDDAAAVNAILVVLENLGLVATS